MDDLQNNDDDWDPEHTLSRVSYRSFTFGGGETPVIRGGRDGYERPPTQSVEAITHSKLRKCLLIITKVVPFIADFGYSYWEFWGGGGGSRVPPSL